MSRANSPRPIPAAPTRSARSPLYCPDARSADDATVAWINAALTAARPQAIGALLRYFRDLDTAEEAFQEACLRALKNWPRNGPPRDPTAWLILVGPQRRAGRGAHGAGDWTRCRRTRRSPIWTTWRRRWPSGSTARTTATTCCGCCSSAAIRSCRRRSRSRWRCASSPGLTVTQIARAFLVSEAAMEQRITRAKARIAARRRAVRDAGRGGARRTSRGRGGHDLPGVQRGLFRGRRIGARAAVRRGHPAGAPAAAAVPDRAGDHGPHRADAAAAGAHRGALRRGRRDRPAGRSGSRAVGRAS